MPPIISVNNIGKKYRLNGSGVKHDTLRDMLAAMISRKNTVSAPDDRQGSSRDFWALKDISFDVNEGEVVGIVGRNGAGKSTLLKILSRITTPTVGEAILNGRVGSLLEVGTGFHPELTGRENVYFNGTILGLRKHEIKARFDEIVAFSGIEAFIDTPIKRYSSGMKMRLAFSVAAHLEPEVMIIDEVLAVGDVDFQTKCLGKMRDVASAGRTVLFVSHNMSAVRQLCSRIVWLDSGIVHLDTHNVDDGLASYTQAGVAHLDWRSHLPIRQEYFTVHDFRIFLNNHNISCDRFSESDRIGVLIDVDIHKYVPPLNFGIQIYDALGNPLFYSLTTDSAQENWPLQSEGHHTITTSIPERILNAGDYSIRLVASLHNERWLLDPDQSVASCQVSVEFTGLKSPYWRTRRPGLIAPQLDWHRL